jgi:ABC-type xylose transport system permease subunit
VSEEGAAPLQGAVARSPVASLSSTLELLREYMIVVCVVVLFLVLTFTSDTFLTSTNLLNVLQQVASPSR